MSEFGRNFDRGQQQWDAMLPPEDPPPVENQCARCGELFETDGLPKILCPGCFKVVEDELNNPSRWRDWCRSWSPSQALFTCGLTFLLLLACAWAVNWACAERDAAQMWHYFYLSNGGGGDGLW